MFVGFPPAFAAIATALHIPLTLVLLGVVLRGAAFTFRTYDSQHDDVQRRWGRVFSIASLLTPILLGVTLGAIASGTIVVENDIVTSGYVNAWLAPFPFAVGFFALTLFAFLAAVYLTNETPDAQLQDDFRSRALAAGVVVGVLALVVFFLSEKGAPSVRVGLTSSWFAIPLHGGTAIAALGAFLCALETPLRARALLRGGTGLPDFVGLGAGAISIHRRTKHRHLQSSRITRDAAPAAHRIGRGIAAAFSVDVRALPHF